MQHGKLLVLGRFKTKMFGDEWFKEKRKGEDKGKKDGRKLKKMASGRAIIRHERERERRWNMFW